MKTLRFIAATALALSGLLLFADDVYTLLRYSCDINAMAAFDPQWGPIDWPTGERPGFAMAPMYVYAFGFWLLAALLFMPWWKIQKTYRGRMCRGAE